MNAHTVSTRRRGGVVPQLRIQHGDRVVLSYLLRSSRTVIGRADTCDIALPHDGVSRTHCVVERRQGRWWLEDRSRHGTLVDGAKVAEVALAPGSSFQMGPYEVWMVDADGDVGATATRMVRPADHEEILDVTDGCATQRAVLVAVDGPRAGERFDLVRRRTRLGGLGAHVVLDEGLPPDAVAVDVVRGRAMVVPGSRPAFLDGQRVRETTPVFDGEGVRVGDHTLEVRAAVVEEPPRPVDAFGELVGRSASMQRVFQVLDRVSRHDATVLIMGASGTGKELAARAVHDLGTRQDRPFVAVNCAAIPEHLVESELFGHEAGAFTGAGERRDGAFQRADGGTLFLDELGEMSADVQAKLLRALSSGEVRRVGAAAPEFPDVRVVAATHRHLARLVEQGTFRRDLLYRLAVLTVSLPPLKDRLDDLPLLASALLARHHPGATLTDEAAAALAEHLWPGNVRELRNVLTRAVVLHGDRIEAAHLTFDPFGGSTTEIEPAPTSTEAAEKVRLQDALRRAGGNRAAAARELGLARTSLLYRLRKHGLA